MKSPIAAILLTEAEITTTLEFLRTAIPFQFPDVPPNALRSVLVKLECSLSDDPTD